MWIAPQNKENNGPVAKATFKPEYRVPKYYFSFFNGPDCDALSKELYFINVSGETLKKVKSDVGGFSDNTTRELENLIYENVKNDEAVKINEFHIIYDSDFIKQLEITIITDGIIEKKYRCVVGKSDSNKFIIIEWNNGDLEKGVDHID